jgi:hypothetical protein
MTRVYRLRWAARKKSANPSPLHASAKTPDTINIVRIHPLAPRYLGVKAAAIKHIPPIPAAEKQVTDNAKSPCMRFRSNENKISDGYRGRAPIEVEGFESWENVIAQRVAVRWIA